MLAALLRAPSYYDPAIQSRRHRAKGRWQLRPRRHGDDRPPERSHRGERPHLPQDQGGCTATGSVSRPGGSTCSTNAVLAGPRRRTASAPSEIAARGLDDPHHDQQARPSTRPCRCDPLGRSTGLTKKQRNLKDALVAVDPSSGRRARLLRRLAVPDVKGYNGRVDYNDYASRGTRPPGSSFKPYTLATVLTQTRQAEDRQGPLRDQQRGQRQLLRADRGHQDLQRPRTTRTSAAPQVTIARRDEVLAQHLLRPAGLAGRPGRRRRRSRTLMGVSTTKDSQRQRKTLVEQVTAAPASASGSATTRSPCSTRPNGYATHGRRRYPATTPTSSSRARRASNGAGGLPAQGRPDPRDRQARVANDVTLTPEADRRAYSGDGLVGRARVGGQDRHRGHRQRTATTNDSDAWMVGLHARRSAPRSGSGTGTSPGRSTTNAGTPLYGSQGLPGKTWMRVHEHLPARDEERAAGGARPAARSATDGTKLRRRRRRTRRRHVHPAAAVGSAPSSPSTPSVHDRRPRRPRPSRTTFVDADRATSPSRDPVVVRRRRRAARLDSGAPRPS